MKKTGLGKDPLSWITPTSIEKEEKETKTSNVVLPKKRSSKENIPKFQTFDVRLTSLLREDQLEFLEKLIRDIQKNRTSEFKKERITKNTLIRVFIDVFMDIELNISNIPDEETLLERVKEKICR
ncbi:hypothetical protein M0P98_08950 [bacterium]|nr:hypothetical protein [bacterium]